MTINKSITMDRVIDAVERHNNSLDNPGFCMACGHEQEGCEPDARRIECDQCGEKQVHGAEEYLFLLN